MNARVIPAIGLIPSSAFSKLMFCYKMLKVLLFPGEILLDFAECLLDFAKMLAKLCRNLPRIGRGIRFKLGKITQNCSKLLRPVRRLDRTGENSRPIGNGGISARSSARPA